jgi:hypothetical protein
VKLFILAGLGVGASLVALAACGSSSSGHGAFSGDGGGGEGGVGDGAGGGDGEGGGIFSKAYFGSVTAGELPGTKTTYTITADFIASLDGGGGGDGGIPCAGTLSGSCCYTPPATASDAGVGDGGVTLTTASAGALLVKDGTTSIANISPGTNNVYSIASTNNPSVTWKPGDTLAVSAAGAAVQAFSGNLTTATEFAGVTPALGSTAATIPIASNLTISWTPGNGQGVSVFLAAVKGTKDDGAITCAVADSAGTISVPSALLGKFTTGDTGLVSLHRTTASQVSAPNATVEMIGGTTTGGLAKYQ